MDGTPPVTIPQIIDFFWRYGVALGVAAWFFWAVNIANPPRYVSYRELEAVQKELVEKEEELKAVTAQRDKLREQSRKGANLLGRAVETAKAQNIEDTP